jgi:hypothetical protein
VLGRFADRAGTEKLSDELFHRKVLFVLHKRYYAGLSDSR